MTEEEHAWELFATGQERWELMMLKSYKDKGTAPQWVIDLNGDPINWAVGLGHTNYNNLPPFVTEFTTLENHAEGIEVFKRDIKKIYEPQLNTLFKKIDFTPPNEYYRLGFLGTIYNRGAGRLAGADAGSEKFPNGSHAWHILKNEKGTKNWMVRAANALAHSHVGDFTPLDVDDNGTLQDGLISRRSFDNALCMWKKF